MNTDPQPPAKLGGRRGRKHELSPFVASEVSTHVKGHQPFVVAGRPLVQAAIEEVGDVQG